MTMARLLPCPRPTLAFLLCAVLAPAIWHCATAAPGPSFDPLPTTENCTELWMDQQLDQFNYLAGQPTWRQRYYLCDQFLDQSNPLAPILFYAGNEGGITGRVNNTGLMWEMAAKLGALLLWGEHRYYGESQPLPGDATNATRQAYLSIEQALVDYVKLVQWVKAELSMADAPVVAFGGSYGGNLAAWLRMKWPNVFYASMASSAPLRSHLVDGQGWDPTTFWQVVTHAASPATGAPADCVPNTRSAFQSLFRLAATPEGRATASQQLGLCPDALTEEGDADMAALYLRNAWDNGAMGSYSFPSSYFTGDPAHPLPAWPIKAMCQEMAGELATDEELLGALGRAVAIFFNATQDQTCYSRDAVYEGAMQTGSSYTFQVCSEFVPNESFFPSDSQSMFWDQGQTDIDQAAINTMCREALQPPEAAPTPDFTIVPALYGTDPSAASNICFFNGLLDPWSSGGILANITSSLVALIDPQGGHHADFNWANPADPDSLVAVRAAEAALLQEWLEAYVPPSAAE